MPAKIARLATRPPFWIPEVSVAVRSSRPSCSKAEKREYSWQIGSHPGNPGSNLAPHGYDGISYSASNSQVRVSASAPSAANFGPTKGRMLDRAALGEIA